uniref:Minor tail protein n=1 Tax=Mycobacterium phage Pharb TaxID=3136626 RepID=A0AAU8GS51_9VIRU
MARAIDRRQLPVDRSPLWSIMGGGIGNLPKLDAAQLWSGWLTSFKMFTGLDLSSPLALVESLGDKIGDALDPAAVVAQIKAVTGLDLSSPHALVASLGSLILGGDGGGLIDPSRLPQIPLANIVQMVASLVPGGAFAGLESVVDEFSHWSYDDSHGEGAAMVTADGAVHDLYSGDLIPVTAGDVLHLTGKARWASLVASGNPIKLGVTSYTDKLGTNTAGRADVAWPVNPSGTLSDWQPLAGQWTVPNGVAAVRLRLTVTDGATAGTVSFAAVDANKGDQLLPINFVANLPSRLAALLGLDVWQDFLDAAKGGAGGVISDLINRIVHLGVDGTFDASQLVNVPNMPAIGKGQVSGLVDDLGSIIDNAVKGAGNLPGAGFGVADLFDALRGMQSNIADANAALAQLQADQAGNQNSGRKLLVNIGDWPESNTVPTIFTNIRSSGAGSVATVGGALEWQDSGSGFAQEFYLYNADELLSDYFEVAFVMPRRPEDEGFGLFSPPYNYLLARGNAAGDTFCFARVGYSRIRIGCVVNGVTTLFGSDIGFSAPAGALVKFRGGTSGGVRVFQVQVNSQIVGGATDSGNVSQVGEAYRKVGLGFEAQGRGTGQGTPGSVSVFAANDNIPNPTRGVGFRAYRATTAGAGQVAGSGPLTASTFDTIDRITPDMQFDTATQSLTIGTEGWYMFPMRLRTGTAQDVGRTWWTGVYRNGVLAAKNGGVVEITIQSNGNAVASNNLIGGGAAPLYCNVGDVIRPAADIQKPVPLGGNSANTVVGDAGGTESWFCAILVNRSLA